jgi:hypothetical protein
MRPETNGFQSSTDDTLMHDSRTSREVQDTGRPFLPFVPLDSLNSSPAISFSVQHSPSQERSLALSEKVRLTEDKPQRHIDRLCHTWSALCNL